MGWASASDIFDPVAQALIDCGADDAVKQTVLGRLIKQLQDSDWDTEDESLYTFRDDPLIVALFHQHGVGNRADGMEADGVLDFDGGVWVLRCEGGRGCGEIGRSVDDSAEEHDRLVRAWSVHDTDVHGGDGEVPELMFINREQD